MKVKTLVKYVGLVSFALGANASFASLTFNPDGAGGDAPVQVDTFDWTTTSFLAQGGTTAIEAYVADPTCPDNSCTFTVYTHAALGTTSLASGDFTTPAGLNDGYEITMVLSFTETVTGVATLGDQSIAAFAVVPSVASFQMFYDTAENADNLSGLGFNDGTLILDSTSISDSNGKFGVNLVNGAPVIQDLDQAGLSNDWPGVVTVTGGGDQGEITMSDFTLDPDFFLTEVVDFTFLFDNISQTLAFGSVDPSQCYSNVPSAVGVGNDQPANANCVAPAIGVVNGLSAINGGGADFIAQTDFNSPVTGTVPVPAPLALLGIGLLGLGWSRRAKR